MSRGYGGAARIALQDENTVVYEYAAYNLNVEGLRNSDHIYDGVITINKASLVEPEIHEKTKRMPSGRKKLIVKRIARDVDYRNLFDTGMITVENSSFCWRILDNGVGMVAMKIIFKLFRLYQEEGTLPDRVGYDV